jgi:hypothetical protein
MADDMIKFLEEGRLLLEEMKRSHELANERHKSANERLSLIQWIVVLILAPIMLSTGINNVNMASKLDRDEAYDLFPTKQKIIYLQNHIFEINERFYAIRESTYIPIAEDKYNKALLEFKGDNSRSSD